MKFTLNPTKCWCHRRPWWPVSVSDAVAVGGAEIHRQDHGQRQRAAWKKVSYLAVLVSARLFLRDWHVCFKIQFWMRESEGILETAQTNKVRK